MKSKTITHIILEGTDGVGKDTIGANLWRKYNFQQRVYTRGEISDYVYAQKFKRLFVSTQRGLPFLYVVLIGEPDIIKRNIIKRDGEELAEEELKKIEDNVLFAQAANTLRDDYHIITIYCKDKTIEELVEEVYNATLMYIHNLSTDTEISPFNKLYKQGCDKLGINFSVRNNQPYFGSMMVMADAQLHNGIYETYTDRSVPLSLAYSLGYDDDIRYKTSKVKKTIDFCYPINSKILKRPEVYEYFAAFNAAQKTFLTTKSKYIPSYEHMKTFNKVFETDYLLKIATAHATILTARDLASLEMTTARFYEAILTHQILFVDIYTDPYNKILPQIFNSDSQLDKLCISLLRVTPGTIVNNYNMLQNNKQIITHILQRQSAWYDKVVKEARQ